MGHTVSETNPFADPPPALKMLRGESPYVTRIRLMWAAMRSDVIAAFPKAPGLPAAPGAYMAAVKDAYARDAYNSLSIEGYRVTNELIARVASGGWKPEKNAADEQSRDARAARGYYLARLEVEASIGNILTGCERRCRRGARSQNLVPRALRAQCHCRPFEGSRPGRLPRAPGLHTKCSARAAAGGGRARHDAGSV